MWGVSVALTWGWGWGLKNLVPPAGDLARQWVGLGASMLPAHHFLCLAGLP